MKYLMLCIAVIVFLSGCGSDDDVGAASGVHFQGRDCLSCHNVDLGSSSHLQIGGTVYKSATSDKNNLNEACSERIHVRLTAASTYNTKDVNSPNSAGFNGRGNIFALIKDMPINTDTYFVELIADDGVTVLGQSGGATHHFTTGFDPNNPSDDNNRYSCNTCHQAPPNNLNSAPGLLFPNVAACN